MMVRELFFSTEVKGALIGTSHFAFKIVDFFWLCTVSLYYISYPSKENEKKKKISDLVLFASDLLTEIQIKKKRRTRKKERKRKKL